MKCSNRLFVYFISLVHLVTGLKIIQSDGTTVYEFLKSLNNKSIEITSKLVDAQWEFETRNSGSAKQELATSDAIKNAKTNFRTVLTSYPWKSYLDPDVRRQLKYYSEIGLLALSEEQYQQFQEIMSELEVIQQNTTICDYYNRTKCDLHLRPEIQEKLETSLNLGEISYLWTEWKKSTEPKFMNLLDKYVNLSNQAAVFNNYKNYKEYSLRNIEVDNPKEEMENLWETLKPLYEQIHAYVRRKLRNIYGEKVVSKHGAIPSQLLGDIWGENWVRIASRLTPFPEVDDTNFTEIMINLNYTPESVRKLAENYYTSMDFSVPDKLWYNITSEEHNEEVCHPKIFNFYNNNVRIKDCERTSFNDYLEDIRLLAKAEYMLQYSHQPFIYQTPADPGLETAVIDILTLSASTFGNLKRLGLYKEEVTEKVRINRLFKIALEKVTAIPFLLVQELWRWNIFDGKATGEALNALNDLRWTFQGISTKTNEFNFNPGGVGSIFSRISLVHDFIGYFFEFQLYEFFCTTSESPEMDECSFFKKVQVGDALRYIMKSGSSQSFKEMKSNLLGQDKIKAESILNYFKPLMNWLKMENDKTGEFIGWKRNIEKQHSSKVRRKKSVDYLLDDAGDDNTSGRERNRFQRFVYKRSESNLDESKASEAKQQNAANEDENEGKAKDDQQKQVRSSEETSSQSNYPKQRRSKINEVDEFKQPTSDQENSSPSSKYSPKNVKRQLDSDSFIPEIYSNFFERGNDNSQLLDSYNSRNSKCGANCNSLNGPYENSRTYAITPEQGGTEAEALSEFLSRNKKRQLDTESFDPVRSYFKEKENFQLTDNHGLRNAKFPPDSQALGHPQDSSSIYSRTVDEEENNDQMRNKHGLRNAKRHTESESLNVPQQIYNQYSPKKSNRRSDWEALNQFNDDLQSYNRKKENEINVRLPKYNALNAKRQMNSFDEFNNGANIYSNPLNIKEKNAYQKRSNGVVKKNYENSEKESNNVEMGTPNKIRYARKVWKNQRQYADDENSGQSHQIARRKENERLSRNVKWHTDTKKDISRLLHSIGLSVENDEKDKVKELKKKLKADSNSELKGGIFSKENVMENMLDFDKIKSGNGKSDAEEEKEANKFWSLKTYLADNPKMMQSSPNLNKKEGVLNTLLSNSFLVKAADEKSVGKKDTSDNSESELIPGSQNVNSEIHFSQTGDNNGARHMGISAASLQAILQKADLNNYGQKEVYPGKPELMENKMKNEITQQNHATKGTPNQYSVMSYKYPTASDTLQLKKEFREVPDSGNSKSPYIIIVGQLSPELREKLMQSKGNSFLNLEKPLLQSAPDAGEKKQNDKRSHDSEQIYIVPVDLKNSQLNLLKPNLYTEHEHEAGHDLNTERDQESEQEQLRIEDNSKVEDKSNFYKTGKENPSEFIISWNNDKNRKIVKRSKREHSKEMINDNNFKLLGMAPVKGSFLENILGKSVDQANLDDKNVQMLIQDALLNGNSERSSTANGESPESMAAPADKPQMNSVQSTSSLSSLASSVISALSPKGYSQASKASNQRQDSDLEEDATKDANAPQAFIREGKDELPFVFNSGVRCNNMGGKKKLARIYANEEARKISNPDFSALDDSSCKKIVLTTCPTKSTTQSACPCPCPCPCPLPCPIPTPYATPLPYSASSVPQEEGKCGACMPANQNPTSGADICCKKPSECSLVNCQFKITKAKKPHERLTIMIYDRINPPAELPEPYDSLAVISEILQRIQSCSGKQGSQLTEEDPDYPANDNMDQLKGGENIGQDNKNKIQELNGEMPVTANESAEEEDLDDSSQSAQQTISSSDEEKYQPREKATPAIDQLTVFNKDKLKPVFIELRKIDDILKKRSQEGQ